MSASRSEGKIDQHTLYKGEDKLQHHHVPHYCSCFSYVCRGHIYIYTTKEMWSNVSQCTWPRSFMAVVYTCIHCYPLNAFWKPKCLNCSLNFPVHYTLGLKGPLVSISDNMPVRELSCLSKLVCFSVNLWWRKNGDHRNKVNIHKLGNHDEAKRMDGWVRSRNVAEEVTLLQTINTQQKH